MHDLIRDVTSIIHYSNYLNGQFVDSDAPRITVINPAMGEEISTIRDSMDLHSKVAQAPLPVSMVAISTSSRFKEGAARLTG